MPELMSGRVEVIFVPVSSAIGYIKSGELRPLGVTTGTRLSALPDVPAIGEFVSGYEGTSWVGIGSARAHAVGDHRDPPPQRASTALPLRIRFSKARLVDPGAESVASSSEQFGKFIADYTERWGQSDPCGLYQVGVMDERPGRPQQDSYQKPHRSLFVIFRSHFQIL